MEAIIEIHAGKAYARRKEARFGRREALALNISNPILSHEQKCDQMEHPIFHINDLVSKRKENEPITCPKAMASQSH